MRDQSLEVTISWRGLRLLLSVAIGITGCAPDASMSTEQDGGTLAPLLELDTGVPNDSMRDRYIVVLRESMVLTRAGVEAVANTNARRVRHIYDVALKGFAGELDSTAVERLRRDPRVAFIEQDRIGVDLGTDFNAGWGLSRIDQRAGPSDNQFTSSFTGQGVNIYLVDGGVDAGHPDFGGRVSASATWNAAFPASQDCTGHGTAIAGVAAGNEYGVAKGANIRSVRVNGCDNAGAVSDWIWGINWVAANRQTPAILSFSKNMGDFFQGVIFFGALDNAIRGAKNAGIFVVVAAGNNNGDACGRSPSQVQEVMVVGATDLNDARTSFSNYGYCVDIFAPGANLNTAIVGGGFGFSSGTSVAAPMVAGVGALLYQQYPMDSPDQIHYAIIHGGTSGVVSNLGTASPNLLLFSTLPAPVTATISGPSLVGPVAFCEWSAVVRAGHGPFTYSWSGVLSGSSGSAYGQVSTSGYLTLDVWDTLGGHAFSNVWVEVDPESLELNC